LSITTEEFIMQGDESLHEWLSSYAKDHVIQRYLEVGVRDGDSLRCVVENSRTLGVVYLADTWGSEYGGTGRDGHGHIDVLLDSLGFYGGRVYLDGDSKATVPRLTRAWADLILIDGDHSDSGAMADLENCWPLLASGGRLVFHDTNHPSHPGLRSVFLSFVGDRACCHEFVDDGHGFGVAWKE
jgi:hypothetical protein